MKKRVATVACLALFAAVATAGDLRLYFSASNTLGEVPVEFGSQSTALVYPGEPAYLWAHVDVDAADLWYQLGLDFTGAAGIITAGEMYNPSVEGVFRWFPPASDLDPVGDNHIFGFGWPGLGSPFDDWGAPGGHYLLAEVVFDQPGEVYLAVGYEGIFRWVGDPYSDLIYFGFGDDPVFGDDYGAVSDLADLYIGPVDWGACCFMPDGDCEVASEEECWNMGGEDWLPGLDCDPNPCPFYGGACCFADGTCSETWDDFECIEMMGGIDFLWGERCDPNPCPQPSGACCFPDASCQYIPEGECYQLGGEWWLPDDTCDPNPCHPDAVFHVDDDAPAGGDGLTWATAFSDLRDAFDIALPGDEMRVAGGTYMPDRGTGDVWATFQLVSSLAVYGGYAGYGAPDPDERDPRLYETVLSGDIGTPGDDWDNSRHVVMGSDAHNVLFDGFTVSNGFAIAEAQGGGGLRVVNGDIAVVECTFIDNFAGDYGGAVYARESTAAFLNCRFFENTNYPWAGSGGAIFSNQSEVTATNCLFAANHSDIDGGAIRSSQDTLTLVNCTFVGNRADSDGGAIYCESGTNVTLANCIVWGNTAPDDPQISGSATVTYSDVEGGWSGEGNIDTDPLFADPDGPDNDPYTWEDNDYRLAFGSPCIDAADNTAVPADEFDLDGDGDTAEPLPFDLDGNPRFVDHPAVPDTGYGDPPIVDIGPYEHPGGCPGDADCDGVPDEEDNCPYHPNPDQADCDDDDYGDVCTIAECDGSAWCSDCNENAVPDACDIDPNDPDGNGEVSDDYDLNGVPDECDPDCNGNGIPDACDLDCDTGNCAEHPLGCGGSEDNNGNGIPDECDPCVGNELATLLASDGAEGDEFGRSVAISGNVAIVGAYMDDDNGTDSGSAYVLRLDGSSWTQEAHLLADDGAAGDGFGMGVGVSGEAAIVGAEFDDDNGSSSGSAYIFRFDGSNWVQEAKLLPGDGASDERFGHSVAIQGDVAVIGAHGDSQQGTRAGAVYVFRYDGSTWIQEAKLLASDGGGYAYFGNSVGIAGETVIAGADGEYAGGVRCGAAYVFRYDGSQWLQEAKLAPADGASIDNFGNSVAISGDLVLVGSPRDDDYGSDTGSAYVFCFDGSTWIEATKLLADDGAEGDYFGFAVSLSGQTAVIGARYQDDNGADAGAAYVFRYDGGQWEWEAKLLASDGAAGDEFGFAAAIGGNTAVVGARYANGGCEDSGSAYVFRGLADCNGNTGLDICDILYGLSEDNNGNGIPDECETQPVPPSETEPAGPGSPAGAQPVPPAPKPPPGP